jgi:prevent-host-death family protein
MKRISSNEAKQSLGRVLDLAQHEPVLICKYNRAAAVVVSPQEFDRLRGLNVAEFTSFCDQIGARAEKRGLTGAGLDALLHEK